MSAEHPTSYLHVGTPKSGTTAIQRLMQHNSTELQRQGVHWAGGRWRRQVQAVRELQSLGAEGLPAPDGPLVEVLRGMRTTDLRASLMSMEWLAPCRPHQIDVVLSELAPGPVELVVTARDLVRTSPSAWQENVQNGLTMTWDEWCDGLAAPERHRPPFARRFWGAQWLPGIIRRWTEQGSGRIARVHVVTLPAADAPGDLWSRMCEVIGIDGAGWQTPAPSNPSLGLTGAALMRRLNEFARDAEVDEQQYEFVLKNLLAKQILPPHSEGKVSLPRSAARGLIASSQTLVRRLREMDGLVVHGDLDDLLGRQPDGAETPQVSDRQMLDLALRSIVELTRDHNLADALQRLERARKVDGG